MGLVRHSNLFRFGNIIHHPLMVQASTDGRVTLAPYLLEGPNLHHKILLREA